MTSIHDELKKEAAGFGQFNPTPYGGGAPAAPTSPGAPVSPVSPASSQDAEFSALDVAYKKLQQARERNDSMAIKQAVEELKAAQANLQSDVPGV